ncbi:hypothetical protein QF037_009953 [Streptomyces canus]|uniref:hypothetical protein n=1 Tax=Streptomyces canus TaxID=58343 RepID=UPI00277F79CD|nr:hypothetical protein [Streptomyces canus]MDQ0605520.1 hypothetical protein [Streptomyces canus]
MIRLATSHAAITAPFVASAAGFPGIPIGRSLLDGRAFHLSPVLADMRILPSTNSIGLGGLGSGKSTTAKVRIRREILEQQHQAVVVDSFGEDNATGEWAPLVRDLGGLVIEAGAFTLNPCSDLFSAPVREQLVRSLILASEPDALTTQATHALQHALNHPKATNLNGLTDALVNPQDGRWPAARLAEWGESAAMALSRYTEGSLRGIFDGEDSALPPTDLPILSFDFTRMDRNSPAIPSLMAAVACWVEQVWLRQSAAVHRHLVLEEAWQILLSPATTELIQRLLKNSRKAALEMNVVMHTLSDLGQGRAQDLARLCEIAHVGRLGRDEAALTGALLGLPQWAIDAIPDLGPGQAVWKVGPAYVDIIQTVIDDQEARLTDTGTRRRAAQQAHADREAAALDDEHDDREQAADLLDAETLDGEIVEAELVDDTSTQPAPEPAAADDWGWEMPPNVIDTRHDDVLQAAREGRFSEAAQLAAIGEREDITAHGILSAEAMSWMSTRAEVAELSGNRGKAIWLRATVDRMGMGRERSEDVDNPDGTQAQHSAPEPPASAVTEVTEEPRPRRRRVWPYVAGIAALGITLAGISQASQDQEQQEERTAKAAAYQGRSKAALDIDGVKADVVAHWSSDKQRVVLELRSYFDPNARFLRIDSGGESASSTLDNGKWPRDPEITLPVDDPLADVTVRIAVGGRKWKEGSRAVSLAVRLSPTGLAYDATTGKRLPSG